MININKFLVPNVKITNTKMRGQYN